MNIFGTFNFCPCRQFNFGSSQDKKQATSGIQQAGDTLYSRAAQTPQEAGQYSGSFDIGNFLQQLFQGYLTGQQAPGTASPNQQFTNQGALQQGLYNQSLQDVQNPYGAYESALQPALQQAQETINSYYQKRGLLNSGLAIGQMGQSAVDLSIKEAQGKMAARQQALSNASALSNQISTGNQNNISNLANLYAGQQNSGLQSLSRQSGAAQQAASYSAYPFQYSLGNYYGQQGALGQGLGALAGAGIGGALGGPTGALYGSAIGGGAGKSLSG